MSMINEHYQEMHGGEAVQCVSCFRYTKDGNPVRHTEDCAVGIEEKVIASASSRCPICGRDTPHTHPQTDLASQIAALTAERDQALDSAFDDKGRTCGNCSAEILMRGGSLGEHGGLTRAEGEDLSICGYCAGMELSCMATQQAIDEAQVVKDEEQIAALEKQLGDAREAIEKEECAETCATNGRVWNDVFREYVYPETCNCFKSRALAALSATPPAQQEKTGMITEERLASLERRIASLEHAMMPMMPIGPNPAQDAELDSRRNEAIALLRDALIRERNQALHPSGGCAHRDGSGATAGTSTPPLQ